MTAVVGDRGDHGGFRHAKLRWPRHRGRERFTRRNRPLAGPAADRSRTTSHTHPCARRTDTLSTALSSFQSPPAHEARRASRELARAPAPAGFLNLSAPYSPDVALQACYGPVTLLGFLPSEACSAHHVARLSTGPGLPVVAQLAPGSPSRTLRGGHPCYVTRRVSSHARPLLPWVSASSGRSPVHGASGLFLPPLTSLASFPHALSDSA